MSSEEYSNKARMNGKLREKSSRNVNALLKQVRKEEAEEKSALGNAKKAAVKIIRRVLKKRPDSLSVLIGERLLGDSKLSDIAGKYSTNFKELGKNAFYEWEKAGDDNDDYLVIAEEKEGLTGRIMRFAVIGKNESAERYLMLDIGRKIGIRLIDNSKTLEGDAARYYAVCYGECGKKRSDK